jgi:hypothetical protein
LKFVGSGAPGYTIGAIAFSGITLNSDALVSGSTAWQTERRIIGARRRTARFRVDHRVRSKLKLEIVAVHISRNR